jgi:hypothetical protein
MLTAGQPPEMTQTESLLNGVEAKKAYESRALIAI